MRLNIYQLYDSSKNVSPNRNYSQYSPENLLNDVILDINNSTVTFEVFTRGTKLNEVHTSLLQFKIQIFKEEEIEDITNYNKVTVNGINFYIPVIKDTEDIKISCSCGDYYWTFRHYNFINSLELQNDTAPYERKTDRPPRNPEGYVGICKHIYQAFKLLQRLNYIQS